MTPAASIVASVATLLALADGTAREDPIVDHQSFTIEVPSVVLTDVPVRKVVIRAYNERGNPDTEYNEQPLITGLRLSLPETDDAKLGPFRKGVLELTTDVNAGRRVYISAPEVVVNAGPRRAARFSIDRLSKWLCLAPAAIAFVLSVWPRNFVLAMFIAVLSGTAILDRGNLFRAFVHTIDSFVEFSPASGAQAAHLTLITVMLFFGALFAVIAESGGLAGLSDWIGRYAKTRERGQLVTLVFGGLTFFDDTAHALIVGKTLRPLSDRLKISREKLAFLVNGTAAPVAALAVVSTWIAAERGTIRDTFEGLGMGGGATAALVASLPYCFYPILVLIFSSLIIILGQDFGPMLRAERRAGTEGQLSRLDLADPEVVPAIENEPPGGKKLSINALAPIIVLFVLIGVGLWSTGRDELRSLAAAKSPAVTTATHGVTLLNVLEHARPLRVFLFSAFVASATAVTLSIVTRSLTLHQALHAWVSGLQRMVPASLILILSWSFQVVCNADHLNTAGFLMEIGQPRVTVEWIPLVAFLTVGATSMLVGSSWAAIPLALPIFVSATNSLLGDLGQAGAMHPLLLATIGAVIAGTVFGRHCSPISETAILSTASSSCSHLDHIFAQLPYVLTIAGVTVLFGYIPIAHGFSPVVLLPASTIVLFVIILFGGQRPIERGNTELEPPTDKEGNSAAAPATAARGKPAAAAGRKPAAGPSSAA